MPHEHRCDFCGKPAQLVRHLVAGAATCICDQCVAAAAAEIRTKDVADGIARGDPLYINTRLDCLRLAHQRSRKDDTEAALIDRAAQLLGWVMGGPALALPAAEQVVDA